MVNDNERTIAAIVFAYESIASILIKMEYLVMMTATGEHERMQSMYEYWDRAVLDLLMSYVEITVIWPKGQFFLPFLLILLQ